MPTEVAAHEASIAGITSSMLPYFFQKDKAVEATGMTC
jgi:hypothetical protein